jgi:hypothetical protein
LFGRINGTTVQFTTGSGADNWGTQYVTRKDSVTLKGRGTTASPLYVDTTFIATRFDIAAVTGTPGGTGTQLQYRNGTAFGGIAGSSVSGGSVTFGTDTEGTVTADNFILSSDKRLKSNIKILRDTKWTDNLVYRSFTMKDDFTNRLRTGFVAQEIEKMAPQFVYTDEKGLKSLDYNGLLVSIVSRQRDQIEDLEARIEKLERLINEK